MTLVAPIPAGAVHIQARVLRTGKHATHVEARIVDGESPLALATGVFGRPRPSTVAVSPPPPAPVEGTGSQIPSIPGLTPNFMQHFAARWLRGGLPFTGHTGTEHVVEVSMRDDGPTTEGHLVAIADFVPPLGLCRLRSPAAGSTLTWMLEFLVDRVDHLPLAGWRIDARLVAARDGYTSQSVMVTSPTGEPAMFGHQSMLVYG
jgi:hypothetical protein